MSSTPNGERSSFAVGSLRRAKRRASADIDAHRSAVDECARRVDGETLAYRRDLRAHGGHVLAPPARRGDGDVHLALHGVARRAQDARRVRLSLYHRALDDLDDPSDVGARRLAVERVTDLDPAERLERKTDRAHGHDHGPLLAELGADTREGEQEAAEQQRHGAHGEADRPRVAAAGGRRLLLLVGHRALSLLVESSRARSDASRSSVSIGMPPATREAY